MLELMFCCQEVGRKESLEEDVKQIHTLQSFSFFPFFFTPNKGFMDSGKIR